MGEITYCRKNDEIECVIYRDSTKRYAPHTHASHLIIGYVEKGCVSISLDGETEVYTAGEEFKIVPNTLHEICPGDDEPYSMTVMCIKTDVSCEDDGLSQLQDKILENPENVYLIDEMAGDAKISPFHMIRKFRKAFGLTPHQFQIQSKVRKAQKLLVEGMAVSDVVYEAGFCDQSHFIRCFQKVVGMTPLQYLDSIRT